MFSTVSAEICLAAFGMTASLTACGGTQQSNSPQTFVPSGSGASMATGSAGWESVTYNVFELPTLGGTQAFANWINDRGWVADAADLTGGGHQAKKRSFL